MIEFSLVMASPLTLPGQLTLPDERSVTLTPGRTRLNVTNSLRVVPSQTGDVTLRLAAPLDTPIYWQLPQQFLGDKVGTAICTGSLRCCRSYCSRYADEE